MFDMAGIEDLLRIMSKSSNLQISWVRCGTRPYEWGTQWESDSLVKKVCEFSLLAITPPEVPVMFKSEGWRERKRVMCFLWWCWYIRVVLVHFSSLRWSVARGFFKVGAGHGLKRAWLVVPEIIGLVGISWLGCLTHQAINLVLPKQVKTWRGQESVTT